MPPELAKTIVAVLSPAARISLVAVPISSEEAVR
jgi:hypothetical protein